LFLIRDTSGNLAKQKGGLRAALFVVGLTHQQETRTLTDQ